NYYWKLLINRTIIKNEQERVVSGIAFIEKPDYGKNIWNIFTIDDSDFQENCINRLIDLLIPKISRFFLNSSEMKSIFTDLDDKGYSILVNKAVSYSHKEEGSISYKKEQYYKVFQEAEDKGYYVDKMEVIIRKNHKFILHGFISREGSSKFANGDIMFFYKNFLPSIASFGEAKREKLIKKEKMADYVLSPIALKFSKDIILETGDNKRIIRSLSNMPHSSVLVYHSNPYLHLSFLDYMDGSNCDIFVSSSNEISIYPGSKASMPALMRIFDQLSKDFEEGTIIEKEQNKELKFSDFIS
ncbi:MAG: hypothetical protein WDA59_07080, partial [Methanofastidiosum sp.]